VGNYPPGATFGPRTLRDFELVWMLGGSCRWRRLDRAAELTLRPGTLLLLRPGMRDEFHWDPRGASSHGYVHFSLDAGPAATDTGRWPLHRPVTGPLEAWLSYLLWLNTADTTDAWIEQMLTSLVRVFVAGPLPATPDAPEPAPLVAALDHVRRQWDGRIRAIPVEELAAAALVSRAHLSRLFRQAYGHGPATALELVRLARAEAMLLRTNLTVTEIGRAVGFPDPLYFSRRFRAANGRSPRAFRVAGRTATALPSRIASLALRLQGAGTVVPGRLPGTPVPVRRRPGRTRATGPAAPRRSVADRGQW
jgi:AraC-like DNA-binding protein